VGVVCDYDYAGSKVDASAFNLPHFSCAQPAGSKPNVERPLPLGLGCAVIPVASTGHLKGSYHRRTAAPHDSADL
jgi:hypothetical protein